MCLENGREFPNWGHLCLIANYTFFNYAVQRRRMKRDAGTKFQSPIIWGTMQYNVPSVMLLDNYEHTLSAFRIFSLECDPKM